jgi:transcriptional regulator with XRE-family HTH domain
MNGRADPTLGYGDRIRRARLGVNKSRRQLAEAVGVHYNSIGRYERGESIPHDRIAIRIAKVTRTTAGYLLYAEPERW